MTGLWPDRLAVLAAALLVAAGVVAGDGWFGVVAFLIVWIAAGRRLRIEAAERKPKPRDLQVGDVVQYGELLFYVTKVDWDGLHAERTLEPLGDMLARSLIVDRGYAREPVVLYAALTDAGWTPPDEPGTLIV